MSGYLGNARDGRGGFNLGLCVNGSKGVEKMLMGWVRSLRIRPGFLSELLNWEIVLKTVISELASESMPDYVLICGDSGGDVG